MSGRARLLARLAARTGALLALLLPPACGTRSDTVREGEAPVLRARDHLPLRPGDRWTYETRTPDRSRRIEMQADLGDVRMVGDELRVRCPFVYGTPESMDGPTTKSVYCRLTPGTAELFLDADLWSLLHEPPILLLPTEFRDGRHWTWRGRVRTGRRETFSRAEVRLAHPVRVSTPAGDFDDAVLTTETHASLDLVVRRWFVPEFGLVAMTVRHGEGADQLRLLARERP